MIFPRSATVGWLVGWPKGQRVHRATTSSDAGFRQATLLVKAWARVNLDDPCPISVAHRTWNQPKGQKVGFGQLSYTTCCLTCHLLAKGAFQSGPVHYGCVPGSLAKPRPEGDWSLRNVTFSAWRASRREPRQSKRMPRDVLWG